MATFTDAFSSGGATLKLTVTRESYSIENNTSYLKCVLQITKNKGYNSYNLGGASISMTINGSTLYSSKEFDIRNLSIGSTKTLATKYITVSHNSDGTKSITCKANFTSGVQLGNASISGTYTCETIPRASTLSLSTTSVNVGSIITANISRKSTNFYHTVEFYISGSTTYYAKYTKISTTQSYTIPTSWYNYMSSSTSCTAYCRITTFNSSGTQIGDKVTKSFTVKVPSSIVPTVGTITFNPWDITTEDNVKRDILIQNNNKFTLSVKDCAAGTGSSIQSYTFSGPGLTTKTQSDTSIDGGPVSSTGSLIYTVKVTDKRGRTATKTLTGTTDNRAYCHAYTKPYIKEGFKIYKAIQVGDNQYAADNNGTYLVCDYTPVYSSVNNTNTKDKIVVTMYCTNGSTTKSAIGKDGQVVIEGVNSDKTYKVYLKITDNYGGEGTTSTKTVFGASRIMNIHPDGTRIAFGKMAEEANCIESKYKIWTQEYFTIKNNDRGLYMANKDGNTEPAIFRNNKNNLWIGAEYDDQRHITGGGTYISAGDNENIYVNKKNGTSRETYIILDTENYIDYISKKPVVLYNPEDATDGNVTLSDSAANYSYLEIFYRNNLMFNDHYLRNSVKISSPNERSIVATITEPDVDGSRIKIKTASYFINGTQIIKENSVYAIIKSGETTVYTGKVNDQVSTNNQILIYKVLGYK